MAFVGDPLKHSHRNPTVHTASGDDTYAPADILLRRRQRGLRCIDEIPL